MEYPPQGNADAANNAERDDTTTTFTGDIYPNYERDEGEWLAMMRCCCYY